MTDVSNLLDAVASGLNQVLKEEDPKKKVVSSLAGKISNALHGVPIDDASLKTLAELVQPFIGKGGKIASTVVSNAAGNAAGAGTLFVTGNPLLAAAGSKVVGSAAERVVQEATKVAQATAAELAKGPMTPESKSIGADRLVGIADHSAKSAMAPADILNKLGTLIETVSGVPLQGEALNGVLKVAISLIENKIKNNVDPTVSAALDVGASHLYTPSAVQKASHNKTTEQSTVQPAEESSHKHGGPK